MHPLAFPLFFLGVAWAQADITPWAALPGEEACQAEVKSDPAPILVIGFVVAVRVDGGVLG